MAAASTGQPRSNARAGRSPARLAVVFVVALAWALALVPLLLGGMFTWGLTRSPCAHGSAAQAPADAEPVTFASADGRQLAGLFLRGETHGTVIVAPALGNDRHAALGDALLLHRGGLTIFTYDSRACAGAPISLGYLEADDAEAALRYLQTRPDVDPARISIHGFSAGGVTAIFAASRLPALRAVSAAGGYHDFGEQLGIGTARGPLETLFMLGARLGYRLSTGIDVETLKPILAVPGIAPRPLLLIYGDREVSLPGARAMLDAARQAGADARLWIVEAAGHGQYAQAAGETYGRRLAEFHRAALEA